MDFHKADEEDEWQELFFEEPDAASSAVADAAPAPVPAAAVVPAPMSAPERAHPASTDRDDAAAMFADLSFDEDPPRPLPRAGAVDAPAVADATVAADGEKTPPLPNPATGPGRWGMAAMSLAAFAAAVSAVGGIVTARNLAALSATQADLARSQAALAQAPAMLDALERLGRVQVRTLKQAAAARPRDAVTKADLRAESAALRRVFSTAQAPGTSTLAGVMRAGQSELAGQIETLHDKIEQVERANAARRR